MTVTTALLFATRTQLVYSFTHDGQAGSTATLTTSGAGAAGADLRVDQVGGAMRQIALANATGIGAVAAGGFTQALARALYMEQDPAGNLGKTSCPRAKMNVQVQSGANDWSVDCDVSGSNPTITMTKVSAAAGVAFLYIQALHTEVND